MQRAANRDLPVPGVDKLRAAISKARALAEMIRKNYGAYSASCGFLGRSPIDPEPIKTTNREQLAICIAGNLTTRESIMQRWREAPSAQTFAVKTANIILDQIDQQTGPTLHTLNPKRDKANNLLTLKP